MTGYAAIDALMLLAEEPSSDKRRELLHAVTDLFMASDTINETQRTLFDDVLTRVAANAGAAGRRDLSVRIAPVDHAPRGIVNQLARDEDISIASPVLRQSKVLSDNDLVMIAETRGQDHMGAVAERQSINSIVTDVLIRRGNSGVLRKVSGNDGAELSDHGAQTLSEKALNDIEIQRNLYRRSDLPEDVAKDVQSRGDGVGNIANHPYAKIIPDVIAQFATLSGLVETRVETMMFEERTDLLVIICKSLDLDLRSFEGVVSYRGARTGKPPICMDSLLVQYNTLPSHAAQRMARFLKIRQTTSV